MLLLRGHGPIIINVVHDLVWNHKHNILIFLVELLQSLCLIEDRFLRRGLWLTFFILFFFLFLADLLATALTVHTILILFVHLDVLLVVLLPLGASFKQVILTSLLAVFFLLNLIGAVLLRTPCGDLPARDIQLTTSDGVSQPLEDASKTSMVRFDRVNGDTFNGLFTVEDCLIGQDFAPFCLAEDLVLEHSLRDLVRLDHPHHFPAELVGAGEADIIALRSSQEHETLHDLREPHHAISQQILELFLPIDVRVEALGQNFKRFVFMLNFAQLIVISRVFNLMNRIAFLVLVSQELFLKVYTVPVALLKLEIINLLSYLDSLGLLYVYSFNIFFLLGGFDTAISVGSESKTLLQLPNLDKALNSFKCEPPLLVSELTVLAHSIKADHVPLALSNEVIKGNLLPIALLRLKLLTASDALITLRCLLLLPGLALLVLLCASFHRILPVRNRLSQRIIEQAATIDQGHSHEAAEAGYALVVNAWLADNFRHVKVLEALHDANLTGGLNALIINRSHDLAEARIVLPENIMGYANVGLQDSTLDEVVTNSSLVCMDELDHLG